MGDDSRTIAAKFARKVSTDPNAQEEKGARRRASLHKLKAGVRKTVMINHLGNMAPKEEASSPRGGRKTVRRTTRRKTSTNGRTGDSRRQSRLSMDMGMSSFASVLRKLPSLASLPDATLEDAAAHFQTKSFKAGDLILKQGEPNESFYIITSGQCCVMLFKGSGGTGRKMSSQVGKPLNRFDTFGQADIQDEANTGRLTSVHALKDTTLLRMTRSMFNAIKPGFGHTVDKKIHTVDQIPLFRSLDKEERARIAGAMKMEEWHDGNYIVHQGQAGTRFYVIAKGECDVVFDEGAHVTTRVATLYENDFFGERAFEDASNLRSSNVMAKGDVTTVSIGREVFRTISTKLQRVLLQVAAMRSMRSRAVTSSPKNMAFSPTNVGFRKSRRTDLQIAEDAASQMNSSTRSPTAADDTATLYSMFLQRLQLQPQTTELFPELARKRLQIPTSASGARIVQHIVKDIMQKKDWLVDDEEAEMLRSMAQGAPLLQKLWKSWTHAQKRDLCKRMTWEQFGEEEVVFEEGQKGDKAYIIMRGMAVCAKTRGMKKEILVTLGPGESFGDLALRGLGVRSSTIEVLPGDSLQCMVLSQQAHAAVMGYTQGYTVEERHQFLCQTKLFEGLDRYEVFRFAFYTKLERHCKGEELVQAGEEAKGLYFIMDGTAKLVPENEKGKQRKGKGKGREQAGGSSSAGGGGSSSGASEGTVVHASGGTMEVKQQGTMTLITKEATTSFVATDNAAAATFSPIAPARRPKALQIGNMAECNLARMGKYNFFGASSVINFHAAANHTSTLKAPKVVHEPSSVVVDSSSMLVLVLPPESFGIVKISTMETLTKLSKAQKQWRRDRKGDLQRSAKSSFQNRRSQKALELEESNSFGEWGAWPSDVKKAREAAKKAGEEGKGSGSAGVSLWLNEKADVLLNVKPPTPPVVTEAETAIRAPSLTPEACQDFLRYATDELTAQPAQLPAGGNGPGQYRERKRPFDMTRLAKIGKEKGFDEFLTLPRISGRSKAKGPTAAPPTPIKPREAKEKAKEKAKEARAAAQQPEKGKPNTQSLTDAPSPADFALSLGLPPPPPPTLPKATLGASQSLPSLASKYLSTPTDSVDSFASTFVTQGFDETDSSVASRQKTPGSMKQHELIRSILGRQADRMNSLKSEKEALSQEVMAAMAALHHANQMGSNDPIGGDPIQYSLSSLMKLQHVHIGKIGEGAEPLGWGWGG
jgi:CRP-like cAMP-binding protein